MLETEVSQSAADAATTVAMLPEPNATERAGVAVLDALAAWSEEPVSIPSLRSVRLSANESVLLAFTTSVVSVKLHYVAFASLRGSVHCNPESCVLCAIGNRAAPKDLLPVLNVIDREVQVLAVSSNMRPGALRAGLLPVLKQLRTTGQPVLFSATQVDTFTYRIGVLAKPDDLDDGSDRIVEFTHDFDAGRVDLTSVFPRYRAEELKAIEEVSMHLRSKGLSV